MAEVKLDTGYNIEVEFILAPFYKRLLAWFIDLLALWLYVYAVSSLLNINSLFIFTDPWTIPGLMVGLPVLFYHLVFEITTNGKSLGKLVMNIQVITAEGGQPTIGQFLIRWVGRLVDFPYWIPFAVMYNSLPWWTMPLTFAGLICIIITSKNQRIGDLVAGTMLIDLKSQTSWEDTVFTELETGYQPRYPQVMQLSDRDLNTLKSIISSIKKRSDRKLAEKISDRIRSKLNIDTNEEPYPFLVTLLKDYNYFTGQ
ncbi:MAG TPA: RDD family protein [Flavitalea sp.]|nr:RDD family protein [Flavitalea sp.]